MWSIPSTLIGRSGEIERVHQAVLDGNGAVLVGDRRIGKTSILRKLAASFEEAGHRVISVSAETHDPKTFAGNLDAALQPQSWFRKERANWGLEIDVGRWGVRLKRTKPDGTAGDEDDLLAWAAEQVAPTRLIVIIDELTVLLGALSGSAEDASGFMHSLRRARQEHGNLTTILAGSIGLHHVVPDGQGTTNDLATLRIGSLDRCDAFHLARCLIAGNEVDSTDEQAVAWATAEVADGIPFYVHYLMQQMISRDSAIEPGDADLLLDQALQDVSDPLDFRHYRERLAGYYGPEADVVERCLDEFALAGALSPDDLHQQLALTDLDPRPTRRHLVALVEKLERDNYLTRTDEGANEFASSVLRRGWCAVQRLEPPDLTGSA